MLSLLPTDPLFFLTLAFGVYLIAFMKGAFGGGFAIVGIPVLSLVMDPVQAGAVLAPLFIWMDVFALYYWRPNTWSKPDIAVLVPGAVVGTALGFFLLNAINGRLVGLVIGVMSLIFTVLWFVGGGQVKPQERSKAKGLVAGVSSGFTSMVAHSGGPPLMMYLLPLGLAKTVYGGTASLFFFSNNIMKVVPWMILGETDKGYWLLVAFGAVVVPLGVWSGWVLHQRLSQQQLYRFCYALLTVTSLKLVWDGLLG